MKKILLANLGNSHIRYIGTTPEVQLKGDRNTPFRESTRYLLEHYEEEAKYIIPEILPPLIELEKNSICKIILFATDSPPGERNNQDTIFEAKILKRLFEIDYPEIEILILPLSIKVTNINALMQFYRDTINELLKCHQEDIFILADAGGTSQQKSALKIILEYLLDTTQLEAYNINFDKGRSFPEKIASDEYRRVLNQQQMGRLVQQYDYTGALLLSGVNWRKTTTPEVALIRVAQALFANDVPEGRRRAHSFPKVFAAKRFVQAIAKGETYEVAINKFDDIISADGTYTLCNILNIAMAHMKTGTWGSVILFNHIFLERFLQEVIAPHVHPHSLTDWLKIRNRIENGEIFSGVGQLGERAITETFSATVPVLLSLARNLNNPLVNEVTNALSNDHQKQFSGFRNKFAHEGRAINENDIRFLFPVFMKWQAAFGVQNVSIFDILNERINLELKK